MKNIILKYGKYLFLFLFFFLFLQLSFSVITSDSIWNYGFSYAIAKGEIPYRDFNMIVPPFSAFFYLIPFLFSGSYIVYNLFQAFLLVLFFRLLEKLYSSNIYLLLLFLVIPFPWVLFSIIFPGYNFLLLFLFVLLLYFEKRKVNDYLVGFLIAILILTKYNVGIFLFLPSFYYFNKDRKKIIKRLIGGFIPIFLFVLYLIFHKNFISFIDQCFFGLLDFQKDNGSIILTNGYFWMWLFLIGVLIWFLFKREGKLLTGYLLAFSIISVPLFDVYHVGIFLFSFSFLFFSRKISIFHKHIFSLTFYSSIFIYFLFIASCHQFQFPNIATYHNFEFLKIDKYQEEKVSLLLSYIQKNKGKNIILLTNDAYFFKIVNELKITHYDLLNYGNHGFHGTDRLISNLSLEKDAIIILSAQEYQHITSSDQLNMEVIQYVLKHYERKEIVGGYEIYQKK